MFFKQFPKVEYDFNRTGIKQNMVDLFRSVRPLPSFLDNFSAKESNTQKPTYSKNKKRHIRMTYKGPNSKEGGGGVSPVGRLQSAAPPEGAGRD